jgi:hypothetical protein
MATRDFPHHFEGNFPEFKERQLLFALTRQLADAQFVRGDRLRTERLWQEAAAEEMDPERIIALLYSVDDVEAAFPRHAPRQLGGKQMLQTRTAVGLISPCSGQESSGHGRQAHPQRQEP